MFNIWWDTTQMCVFDQIDSIKSVQTNLVFCYQISLNVLKQGIELAFFGPKTFHIKDNFMFWTILNFSTHKRLSSLNNSENTSLFLCGTILVTVETSEY